MVVNDRSPSRIAGADSAYDAHGRVGISARHLLSGESFTSLAVEIQAVEGFEPTQEAINSLHAFLSDRLDKPAGIRIVRRTPIRSPGKASYSIADARKIEDQRRQLFANGRELAAYILFVDGPSSDDTPNLKTLGQAHRNTSIAIFEPTIRALSGAIGQPYRWVLEATILQHEFGHVLGLVNAGSPLQSNHASLEDSGRAHCSSPTCLMNFNSERLLLTNGFFTQVPSMDAACIQDLQANGGR
jgi:hypothetical protein